MKKNYYVVVIYHYKSDCTIGRVEIVDKVFRKWNDAEKEREDQFKKHQYACGIQIRAMELN